VLLVDVNEQALDCATVTAIRSIGLLARRLKQPIPRNLFSSYALHINPNNRETSMDITRSSIETQKGPADWFTGDVYIDAVAAPAASSTFAAALVHFTPGARTAWHTHPHGQTIYVTEGVGRCQRGGGDIQEIRPGDRVFFGPGENHWHGAAPDRFMAHIAMQQNDESGSPVTWGEHVTDEQYNA
jgi:quercetin dioxygenase-like cupin family protein